jgi:putative serine protease PepD
MLKSKLLPILSAAIGGLTATLVVLIAQPFGTTVRTETVTARSSGTTHFAAQTTGALTARQIYEQDAHGVVAIRATTKAGAEAGGEGEEQSRSPFGREQSAEQTDTGTGIVFSKSGLIVTNDHVVKGATEVTVSFDGGSATTRRATVVGEDASADLAVLRVDPSGLELDPLTFADSSQTEIGEAAYAIGNPFGLNWTLTTGVISALDRTITSPNGTAIKGVLQTDAALNPGNSGGPLLNAEGEVVGINSQIVSGSSTSTGQGSDSGVGFAIPSNTVKAVVRQLDGGTPA